MTDLRARLAALLESRGAGGLTAFEPLGGGACQELFRVELEDGSEWVLRSDAKRSLPGSLDRSREFVVVERAAAAGVRTPAPRWLCNGLLRDDAWAYFLPWTRGEALGGRVVRGKELKDAREGLCAELAVELATLARVVPETEPALVEALGEPPPDPASAAIESLAAMANRLGPPRPAIELALLWLREHRPAPSSPSLVHGDFRVGNFLVAGDGLRAVLDWEFAHWGDPAEDLAWLCVRDWRFGRDDLAAGGLGTREALVEAYREAGGPAAAQEPDRLRFWEVYGNARWAVGARFQAERYLSGAQQDLELLAIGWRALELEYETLRQIGDSLELPVPLAKAAPAERPDPATLLVGLADCLNDLPRADRGWAFRLKIADALLRSLANEVPQRQGLEAQERARLEQALGLPATTPAAGPTWSELESQLCARVRETAPDLAEQTRLRVAVSLGLAATLQVRNPRFNLSRELP